MIACFDGMTEEEILNHHRDNCKGYGVCFYQLGNGWYATHVVAGELGPFDTEEQAINAVRSAWLMER